MSCAGVVCAANSVPTISGTPTLSVAEGAAYSFTPTAKDADGNTLTFSVTNRPVWAVFSSTTGKLSGTPNNKQAGSYANVSVKVSDGKGGTATLAPFTIVVSNVNQAPTISGTPSTRAFEGTAYSFKPTARDADSDALVYSVTGLPSWAVFNSATGQVSGTPGYDKAGTYSGIVVSVSDGTATASLAAFSIAVSDTNRSPTISGTPTLSVAENSAYTFTPSAADADGNPLTFSISGKPQWATLDAATGKLSGTPGLTSGGTYPGVTLSVSDGRARVSLPAFTITVSQTNQSPSIAGSPPSRAIEGRAYTFTPTGTDPDADKLTFSVVNKPAWAAFDPLTGKLSGTPPAGSGGLYPAVAISVSDGKLSASLAAFDLYVYSTAGVDQPRGIYSIDKVVDKPFVDGVAVRPKWTDMEPVEGSYDFSKIDRAVRDAHALGQQVTIASLVNFVPDWLLAKAETFAGQDGPTIVPWDEVTLQAMERLAQAQAAHTVDGIALRDHPAVTQINASVAGILSIRLIDLPPGYNSEKFDAAVHRSLGIWADAYPSGKHLYVGLFAVNDGLLSPSTAERLRDSLLQTFDGIGRPRMHFFQELLTGRTPQTTSNLGTVLLGVEGRGGVMFQACGPWTDQASGFWSCNWLTPADSPDLGFKLGLETYGSVYFEIYNGDLENAAYATQFEAWRTRIDQQVP